MYINIHIYIYIHTCMYICTLHIYIYVHIYIYIFMYTHVFIDWTLMGKPAPSTSAEATTMGGPMPPKLDLAVARSSPYLDPECVAYGSKDSHFKAFWAKRPHNIGLLGQKTIYYRAFGTKDHII